MFELLKVVKKTSSGPSEWKKNTRKCVFAFFSSLDENMVHFYRVGYTVEGDGLHAFFYILILYESDAIKFKKFVRTYLLADQTKHFK